LKVRSDELDYSHLEHWIEELDLSEQWHAARKLAGLE